MRVDLRDSSAPGVSAPLAGAGVAALVGLAELIPAALTTGASPQDLQRGVLLVLAVYVALGALAGLACWAASRVWAAPAAALALLAAIAVISAGTPDTPPIVRVAGVALGLVTLRAGVWSLRQVPDLPRARLATSAALLALAGVAALAARALPAYGPRWALGAAVAAVGAAVLVWTPRVRASALLLAGTAVYLLWQGAEHVQRLAPAVKPAASAPSVLLVTVDALRADRVGAYGHASARTPNLDALAAQGTLFEKAFAHSVVTGPSHATILSGRSPLSTRFLREADVLAPEIETLAEALARAGYVTAAFPSTAALLGASGPSQRFQHQSGDLREHRRLPAFVFRCVALRPLEQHLTGPATWPPYRPARATTDLALQFLEVHAAAPTFSWVHYADANPPYVPPPELRAAGAETAPNDWPRLSAQQRAALVADPAQLAALRGLYDAEVATVDRELGRLVAAAREHAPAGGLLVVIASSHGEPMGEHGHYWFRDLHDTTLHVPLLMLPPPRIVAAPRRVPEVVRLMDVAPTILDWLGLPKLAQAEGASLAPLAAGSASGSPGPLVAVAEPEPNAFTGRAIAVRRDAWKLIRRDAGLWASDRWSPGGFALFDLASDPAESVDLASTRPDVLHQLGALLPPGWEKPPAPPLAPPSAGAERVLEDRE